MKLLSLLLLVCLLILAACHTSSINYTKFNPPKIRIAEEAQRALVVHRFDSNQWDFNQKKKIEVHKSAYRHFLAGLKNSFSDFPHLTIEYDTMLRSKGWLVHGEKYKLDSIWLSKFALDKDFDYYILINEFDIDRPRFTESVKKDDNSRSKKSSYYLETQALIDLRKPDGTLVNEAFVFKKAQIESRRVISGTLAVGPSVGNFGKVADRLAYQLSDAYREYFFPWEEIVKDYYFVDGPLEGLVYLMESKQWTEARQELLILYQKETDEKLRRHIAHNLSVVYYALGFQEESKNWRAKR